MRAPGGDLLPVLLKKGSDAAPEETNDAVCRKRNATPSLTSASTATKARRSRLGAQWSQSTRNTAQPVGYTGEDIDPEECVVENS